MAICARIRTQRNRRLALIVLALAQAQAAFGQAPAPPPEPPPPRLEASAQLTFLDTRGDATSQSLGAGVEQRHVIEGGLSYLALDAAPHTLRLDGGLVARLERPR